MESKRLMCLNLGCGNALKADTETETWVNMDQKVPVGASSDVTVHEGSILNVASDFTERTFDLIKSDYVFEHLELKEICDLLYQLHSILKDNGVLKVIVPDFLWIVDQFDKSCSRDEDAFDVWTEVNFRVFGDPRQTFHKTVWTRHSSPLFLKQCGFFDVEFISHLMDGDGTMEFHCTKKDQA